MCSIYSAGWDFVNIEFVCNHIDRSNYITYESNIVPLWITNRAQLGLA